MTIPSLLFGLLIAACYGALYHLFRGGSIWRLLIYLGASMVGFVAGHFIGAWRGWTFAAFGPLYIGSASVGSVFFLVLSDWLTRIEPKHDEGDQV